MSETAYQPIDVFRTVDIPSSLHFVALQAAANAVESFTEIQNPQFKIVGKLALRGLTKQEIMSIVHPLSQYSRSHTEAVLFKPRISKPNAERVYVSGCVSLADSNQSLTTERHVLNARTRHARAIRNEPQIPALHPRITFGYTPDVDSALEVVHIIDAGFPTQVSLLPLETNPEYIISDQPVRYISLIQSSAASPQNG